MAIILRVTVRAPLQATPISTPAVVMPPPIAAVVPFAHSEVSSAPGLLF